MLIKKTMIYRRRGFLDKDEFLSFWNQLLPRIEREYGKAPYPGYREAGVSFQAPHVRCTECEGISLAVMRLLLCCAYHTGATYGKMNIGYHMRIPREDTLTGVENVIYREDISFMIGPAIPLTDEEGNMVRNMDVYDRIYQEVLRTSERYKLEVLSGLFLRIYLLDDRVGSESMLNLSSEELANIILELWNFGSNNESRSGSDEERKGKVIALPIKRSKKSYPKYITSLKQNKSVLRPFIVADLETILVDDEHVPYAAGFQVIRPGEDIASKPDFSVELYFSEDLILFENEYSKLMEDRIMFINKFIERCHKMFFLFIERLKAVVTAKDNKRIRTVYFHNLRRFDGILLIQHFINQGNKYRIKPLFRNHYLYKLSLYEGKKLLFTFKCSLNLLPGSLASLAKTLCPELGPKGTIPHEDLKVEDLYKMRIELKDYTKQDVRLLGGIMSKAQSIYYSLYDVDIENILSIASSYNLSN